MRISDWSSDVCSSDLGGQLLCARAARALLSGNLTVDRYARSADRRHVRVADHPPGHAVPAIPDARRRCEQRCLGTRRCSGPAFTPPGESGLRATKLGSAAGRAGGVKAWKITVVDV